MMEVRGRSPRPGLRPLRSDPDPAHAEAVARIHAALDRPGELPDRILDAGRLRRFLG
ncbi:MAG: hypothetical protein GXP50_05345 [Deltaproteobacteria bacterium]|nr:hypothetical protein [Deltaproteobacteria bacterium]